MPETLDIEKQQRANWDRFASGWIKWDPQVTDMQAPVGREIIRLLALAENGVHLDIASGTGEPGLSIAALMPKGRVVLTDLSEAMLAAATAKVEERSLTNVEVRVCGVDDLPFEDASFDTVSCRFGFMFFPDIHRAVAGLARVMRPGGRVATAVWAEPAGNPWATMAVGAISAEVELPAPQPDAPGMFRCAAPGSVAAIFREAGFHDVAESEVRGFLELGNGGDYWSLVTEVTPAVVAALSGVDESARERIRAATIDKAQAFEKGGELNMPYHARCIVGTR